MKVDNDLRKNSRGTSSPLMVRFVFDPPVTSNASRLGGQTATSCAILCSLKRARTVIEIGLAYGGSALAIAEALVANGSSQRRHLIIDPYQNPFYGSGWSVEAVWVANSASSLNS